MLKKFSKALHSSLSWSNNIALIMVTTFILTKDMKYCLLASSVL
uniref:Uncharacterized protein n=1 Tax=Rhizophora mucronata TaxID=61149 RepID=A0A2P2KGA3_RHIMU